MNKQGRRNLRHARIGQPDSGRRYLKADDVKSRILCIEIHLPEDEDPVDIYFRPIPTSRVFALRGLGKDGSGLDVMLELLAEFVIDPQTGDPLALSAEDWDRFGGAQDIVAAMVDASGAARTQKGAGPTTLAEAAQNDDMMVQVALEVMRGDPTTAAAFQKAASLLAENSDAAALPDPEPNQNESPIAEATNSSETPNENLNQNPNPNPNPSPDGTSAETP